MDGKAPRLTPLKGARSLLLEHVSLSIRRVLVVLEFFGGTQPWWVYIEQWAFKIQIVFSLACKEPWISHKRFPSGWHSWDVSNLRFWVVSPHPMRPPTGLGHIYHALRCASASTSQASAGPGRRCQVTQRDVHLWLVGRFSSFLTGRQTHGMMLT